LDTETIGMIAAGEVVHSVGSAIKELIENSIDAGATKIEVMTTEGGLGALWVRDDGCGIAADDMESLCARFATSKLRSYTELATGVSTFGFRGEALSAISHSATVVVVTTKIAQAQYAYRCTYKDGKMVGQAVKCAGTKGTVFRIEGLLNGQRIRRRAAAANDQYNEALRILTSYCIHVASRGIGLICRKVGGPPDIDTTSCQSTLEVIKHCLGPTAASDAIPISRQEEWLADDRTKVKASVSGYCSSGSRPDAGASGLHFWVNNRLVEHDTLQRKIDETFKAYSPYGTQWTYLSLCLDPSMVDVNVHPAKTRVTFLHEAQVIDFIARAVTQAIRPKFKDETIRESSSLCFGKTIIHDNSSSEVNHSSGKAEETDLSSHDAPLQESKNEISPETDVLETCTSSEIDASEQLIRHKDKTKSLDWSDISKTRETSLSSMKIPFSTDAAIRNPHTKKNKASQQRSTSIRSDYRDQSIESFLQRESSRQSNNMPIETRENTLNGQAKEGDFLCNDCGGILKLSSVVLNRPGAFSTITFNRRDPSTLPHFNCNCTQLSRLSRKALLCLRETQCPYDSIQSIINGLRNSLDSDLATKLHQAVYIGCLDEVWLLVQMETRLVALDYRRFSYELFFQLALCTFGRTFAFDMSSAPIDMIAVLNATSPDLAANAIAILQAKADLLGEYFNIRIKSNGHLIGLPCLLPGHPPPSLSAIPSFLLGLATKVDWTQEKSCFLGVAVLLADLYSDFSCRTMGSSESTDDQRNQTKISKTETLIRDILFPAFKACLIPNAQLYRSACVDLSSINRLYRVFERS